MCVHSTEQLDGSLSMFEECFRRLRLAEMQLLLLMRDLDLPLADQPRLAYNFVSHRRGQAGSGNICTEALRRKLESWGLITTDEQQGSRLNERGREFVDGLMQRGVRADFFTCPLGEWGTDLIDPLGLTQVLKAS